VPDELTADQRRALLADVLCVEDAIASYSDVIEARLLSETKQTLNSIKLDLGWIGSLR
jgi:hypothetical protein